MNALDNNTPTVTGQVLGEGVGIRACFEALRPRWTAARAEAKAFNAKCDGPVRRGVGVAGMWYGCGNTSLPNPSTIRVGLKADGRIALHQGAVDIGQGSNTIVTQICADALGAPYRSLRSGIGRYFDHARLRQDLGISPDFCHRQSRTHGGYGTAPRHPAPGRRV